MNRNTFLKQSSALAALALIPSSCVVSFSNTSFPLGLQLYTVRDFMAKDPIGTLKKLKAMGYSDFESYGFDTVNKTYYGYSANEFKTISILKKTNWTNISNSLTSVPKKASELILQDH